MELPFQAYRGEEPYVFVCYAHADAGTVYPEIARLHGLGVRVCYDEGISPGELFTDELAELIEGASVFLYFVTPRSVQSRSAEGQRGTSASSLSIWRKRFSPGVSSSRSGSRRGFSSTGCVLPTTNARSPPP